MTLSEIAAMIDKNGDGELSCEELHDSLLEHLGILLSDSEMDSLVALIDVDKSGVVRVKEFITVMRTALNAQQRKQSLERRKSFKAAAATATAAAAFGGIRRSSSSSRNDLQLSSGEVMIAGSVIIKAYH